MDELQQRVALAQRRLITRRWFGATAVWLAVSLGVAAIAVAVPRLVALSWIPHWWDAAWLVTAGLVGVVGPTVLVLARRTEPIDAAAEIDRRFGLRERVASCLSLEDDALDSPAGEALRRDAVRAMERVDVAERFPLGLDHRAWLPIGPALVALLLSALVANRQAVATVAEAEAAEATAEDIKEAAERARRELRKRTAEAEKRGLDKATDLLREIEQQTTELAKRPPDDPSQAAVKLNDLAKQLERRRGELGAGEQLRKQLNRLGELARGPAEKAADAMRRGDWRRALEAVEKLRKELVSGEVTDQQKKQLAAQMEKLQQRLGDAAKQAAAQRQELQRQLAEAQRKGDAAQADKLRDKLDRLAQQAPQMQQLQQMAQQMQQAQQALQQGKPQQAADAMQQMAQQLQQLQQEAAEMEMLDAAMTDIQMAKADMGLEAGQMPANALAGGGQGGEGEGDPNAPPGEGMGSGRGTGPRPDEANDVNFRDSRVRQSVGRGSSTFGGLVDGPSVRGEVVESIKTGLTTDTVTPADPLTSERLPRSRQEHAEDYFRGLRERL